MRALLLVGVLLALGAVFSEKARSVWDLDSPLVSESDLDLVAGLQGPPRAGNKAPGAPGSQRGNVLPRHGPPQSEREVVRVSVNELGLTDKAGGVASQRVPRYRLHIVDEAGGSGRQEVGSDVDPAVLESFLETGGRFVEGLVASYDFNSVETQATDDDWEVLKDPDAGIPSKAGPAGPLRDIGSKCDRGLEFVTDSVKGEDRKVARFQKGTGLLLQSIKKVLPSDEHSAYTILMRVKLDSTSCYGRLINTIFGEDGGLYTCDTLRVYPIKATRATVSRDQWHDIALATNPQREVFVYLDGSYIMGVVADQATWETTVAVKSDSMTFFNDVGPQCDIGGEEETSGYIARIWVYDRVMPAGQLKRADDDSYDIAELTYERFPNCQCEQLSCECEKVCECRAHCITGDLARGHPTTQVSTGWGGHSYRAVDGDQRAYYGHGHCTHTGYANEPWWRVDLQSERIVSRVLVKNRADCCAHRLNGFEVHIGNDDSSWKSNPRCGNPVDQCGHGDLIELRCGDMKGRYVFVAIPGRREYLHVCGVEVFYDNAFELGPCVGGGHHVVSASQHTTSHMHLLSTAISPAGSSSYYDGAEQDSETEALLATAGSWVLNDKPSQNFAHWLRGTVLVLSENTFVLLKFDTLAQDIRNLQTVKVWEASLRLYSTDHKVNCTEVTGFAIKEDWDPSLVTWATKPSISNTPLFQSPWAARRWVEFQNSAMTEQVTRWIRKDAPNYGIALTCTAGFHGIDGIAGPIEHEFAPRVVMKFEQRD